MEQTNKNGENDIPVLSSKDGINLKIEKMVPERLYHCVYDNKVFLFYKDEEGLLHCYEVEDKDVVNEILKNPSEIEKILIKHSGE
jgi:hypothetical protein